MFGRRVSPPTSPGLKGSNVRRTLSFNLTIQNPEDEVRKFVNKKSEIFDICKIQNWMIQLKTANKIKKVKSQKCLIV